MGQSPVTKPVTKYEERFGLRVNILSINVRMGSRTAKMQRRPIQTLDYTLRERWSNETGRGGGEGGYLDIIHGRRSMTKEGGG